MEYEIIVMRGIADGKSTYDSFLIKAEENVSVLWALEQLNMREKLITKDGRIVEKISLDSNCRQKMCGSCAMLINGIPRLACHTFLRDLSKAITLEPFKKFPRIKDLIVDKSIIHDNMMKMDLWLHDEENNPAAAKYLKESTNNALYDSASCIMCGCCLEACPNYTGNNDFFGALLMNEDYKLVTQQDGKKLKKQKVKQAEKHFSNGCSNSFACQEVCPMRIPLSLHISRLNGLAWRVK